MTNWEDDKNNLPVDAPLGTAALAKVPSDNTISTYNDNTEIRNQQSHPEFE